MDGNFFSLTKKSFLLIELFLAEYVISGVFIYAARFDLGMKLGLVRISCTVGLSVRDVKVELSPRDENAECFSSGDQCVILVRS